MQPVGTIHLRVDSQITDLALPVFISRLNLYTAFDGRAQRIPPLNAGNTQSLCPWIHYTHWENPHLSLFAFTYLIADAIIGVKSGNQHYSA